MKRTGPWFWLLVGIAVLSGGVAYRQGRSLESLRSERALIAETSAGQPSERGTDALPRPPEAAPPLSPDERLELMNLRRRVTELSDNKRRMARLVDANVALRERFVSVSNLVAKAFPPDWKRGGDARQAGQATPEAAFETFVWSLHHRDTNVLFQAVVPEMHENIAREWEKGRGDEFWKAAVMIPGFRFKSVTPGDDGGMVLDVESVPGFPSMPVKTRVVDGTWRVAF